MTNWLGEDDSQSEVTLRKHDQTYKFTATRDNLLASCSMPHRDHFHVLLLSAVSRFTVHIERRTQCSPVHY